MKRSGSNFTSFVLDLHKKSTNFCRAALVLIDKYLEEGKTSISLCSSTIHPSSPGEDSAWKTLERGVPGRALFNSLMSESSIRSKVTDFKRGSRERIPHLLLSVSSEECPARHRNILQQSDLRDHLVLPLYYEKKFIGILSVFRGREDPYFTSDDLHILEDAAKCISSIYYRDNRQFRNIDNFFHRFLDDMDIGAALIDRQLRIIDSNTIFNDYMSYVWKEGILTGKIPNYAGSNRKRLSDPQKLIYHFGSRIIVRPEKLICDCMLYNYRLYTKPLAFPNTFGEIETIYVVYVSQYKKVSSEETMELLDELTPRETEILMMLTEGYDNTQISNMLHISTYTVKSHLQKIYRKLDVTNKTELITKLYGK